MKKNIVLSVLILAGSLLQQGKILAQTVHTDSAGIKRADGEIVLTLQSAVSLALEKNKDVLISNEDMKRANAQISEAYGNAYPQVSAEANYTRNLELPSFFIAGQKFTIGSDNSYTASLSLSQVLFSAKVNTAIQIAKEYKHYSEHNAQAVREDVVLNVKKAFYTVLLTQRLVEVSREGLRLARANHENLSQLYKQGMASEFDLLRAEVQVANTEPMLSQAENGLVMSMNALRNALGISLNQKISLAGSLDLEDELPKGVIEQESGLAVSRNSLLLGLEAYERILEKNITIQKADYYPTLAAFGAIQYQTQDNTFKFMDYDWVRNTMVGLQLSVPIFSGFQTRYRVEQAQIDRFKTQLNRQKLEEGLKIQVEDARLRMEEAKSRISAQARSVEQAERAQGIAEVRFKSGVGTQLELIDTQVALTNTRINKAQAVYDYLVARADWERSTGYVK